MKKREIPEIDGVGYSFESVIGQGGTAEVWGVRSLVDNQAFALKRIAKGVGSSARDERFRNEIGFGLLASNDHVVKIHSQFEDENYFYYIMDLYSASLRKIIEEEFDFEVLLDYLSQLCDGLAYVHGQGIVHRDIKPENILVDSANRRLVLADFGIAHFKDSTLTKRGEILANRNYQAPEQMAKKDPAGIGQPADVFALGLLIAEMFTKQNSRGARYRRVGDVHPFLSDLDLLVERMMLQDATQRIRIQAVRDMLDLIRRQVDSKVEEIVDDLRHNDAPTGGHTSETEQVLDRAGKDVLSAKYIYERATDAELSRYNPSYHCEISYSAKPALFNLCVQSRLYSICKKKFEYEGNGGWSESDLNSVVSPRKAALLQEFESIQRRYPLAQDSFWDWVPRQAVHYFRFCKDYHCDEVLARIREVVSDSPGSGVDSLQRHLVDAPLLSIAQRLREVLGNEGFGLLAQDRELVELERHLNVHWDGTSPDDSYRMAVGANLFGEPPEAESIARIFEDFESKWGVSIGERADGRHSIHFRSRDEYLRFREEALATASQYDTFTADVLDLLRPELEDDDLVALIWEPVFEIPITLARILGLHEISERPV